MLRISSVKDKTFGIINLDNKEQYKIVFYSYKTWIRGSSDSKKCIKTVRCCNK